MKASIQTGLTEETKVPLKWVFIMLAGASGFVGGAVGLGMYFGGRDASAAALVTRVDKLEDAVKKIPEIAEGVARLEGAFHTNPNERLPASNGP